MEPGKKLGIGLLERAAAAEALTRPLAEQQPPITFEDVALAEVLDASQCHPYFVQLWGAELWACARGQEKRCIDEAVVAQARPAFEQERSAYYEDRREELQRQDLLALAARVAEAFDHKAMLREHELDAVIAEAAPGDVLTRRDALAGLGYVWKAPGDEDRWRAGIPSLMTYVAAHAEA